MAGDNAQQIQEWNGALGERWAREQEEMDALLKTFNDVSVKAANPQPGERILDVGCGCGGSSLMLAEAVGPAGLVVGVDVSAPMLAIARRRAEGMSNLRLEEGDASTTLLPSGLDLIYSRFGIMFFDDPPAAFAHLRKALKPSGRLAFLCWQAAKDNPWASLPVIAARKALGIDPPPADPYAPGPFAFADPLRVAGILTSAGFQNIQARGLEAPVHLGSTLRSAAEGAARMGPASRLVREHGQDKLAAIVTEIERALAPLARPDGSVAPPGRTWIVTAQAG